ncbi:hypothetical protein BDK51DRAFT_46714 [Blyttiomyces helicus]|uniref:Uncharacterized protein n=1 Tax=Blyttiomyces helicus TaxID=388810 RepID=A0A4P9WC48_9FUNG|nr:hypothetical protein BDK51DRAFT_46714 [Blyttiomyces helicus]|eukprot:RKO89215.1 hypothetical protein BDK51DRAFT_46714 [Blyttiomyces helicus]
MPTTVLQWLQKRHLDDGLFEFAILGSSPPPIEILMCSSPDSSPLDGFTDAIKRVLNSSGSPPNKSGAGPSLQRQELVFLYSITSCKPHGLSEEDYFTLFNTGGAESALVEKVPIQKGFNKILTFAPGPCPATGCTQDWVDVGATVDVARWYHSMQTWSDGQILMVGGSKAGGLVLNTPRVNEPAYEISIDGHSLSAVPLPYPEFTDSDRPGKSCKASPFLPKPRTFPASDSTVLLPLKASENYRPEAMVCGGSSSNAPSSWLSQMPSDLGTFVSPVTSPVPSSSPTIPPGPLSSPPRLPASSSAPTKPPTPTSSSPPIAAITGGAAGGAVLLLVGGPYVGKSCSSRKEHRIKRLGIQERVDATLKPAFVSIAPSTHPFPPPGKSSLSHDDTRSGSIEGSSPGTGPASYASGNVLVGEVHTSPAKRPAPSAPANPVVGDPPPAYNAALPVTPRTESEPTIRRAPRGSPQPTPTRSVATQATRLL